MTKWIRTGLLVAILLFAASTAPLSPVAAAEQKATVSGATDVSARRHYRHTHYRYAYRPYYYGRPSYYAPAPFLPIPPFFGYGWEGW
jgi:hypothetical protein